MLWGLCVRLHKAEYGARGHLRLSCDKAAIWRLKIS
jgi:hypothetical protein